MDVYNYVYNLLGKATRNFWKRDIPRCIFDS